MGLFDTIIGGAEDLTAGAIGGLPGLIGAGGGVSGVGGGSGIAGVGTIAADALTGGAISNADAVVATNAQNLAFDTQMANTSYQRGVADLTAAGLNPALAYSNGGDPSPTANLTAPRPGDVGAGLLSTAASAASGSFDLRSKEATISNTESSTNLNKDLAVKADSDAQLASVNTGLARQRMETETHSTREAKAKADSAEMDTGIQSRRYKYDRSMATKNAIRENIDGVLGTVNSAADVFKKPFMLRPPNGAFPGSFNPPSQPAPSRPDLSHRNFDWLKQR